MVILASRTPTFIKIFGLLGIMLGVALTGCSKRAAKPNILRTILREHYKVIDPAHGQDFYSNTMIARCFEGLLGYHYLKRPYQLEPVLAETMPTVSKDGRTLLFKIRKGVYFHDDPAFKLANGQKRELVAEDFIYSIKRVANPFESSEGWWTLDGKIKGLNEWRELAKKNGKPDFSLAVSGLRAQDRYTLVLELTQANPLFLNVLAMPYTFVVAHEVVDAYQKEVSRHPIGTGPFVLANLTPNKVSWVRNNHYWNHLYPSEGSAGDREQGRLVDAGKPIPFIDGIEDDIIIEDQPQWLNFMQANADYLEKVPKDSVGKVFKSDHSPSKAMQEKEIQVQVAPGTWFNYIAFNMEDPVVGGVKNQFLRQAMALAYDEAPTIEQFYLGLAVKAQSVIPPGILGYDETYRNPSRVYNLAKAKEILVKHGHADGQGIGEIVYDALSDTTQRQIAEYFQRSMSKLGLHVKIQVMSWPEMLNRIRKKQAQIWGISWLYDYPDAENGWQLLYSKNESPGSNEANFKNKKFDQLYEKIAIMNDSKERRKLFTQMNAIFAEEVPWIITIHQAETRLVQGWVKNFKIHAFDRGIEKYLRIDETTKQTLSRRF